MANYLYRTTLYKTGVSVINESASNDTDRTDFENNYKGTASSVTSVIISETTFETELSYSAFKTKIALPILWSDVKYVEDDRKYSLNLLSEIAL